MKPLKPAQTLALTAAAVVGMVICGASIGDDKPAAQSQPQPSASAQAQRITATNANTNSPAAMPQPTAVAIAPPKTAPARKPAPEPPRASSAPETPYYKNCDAVRDAGADPLYPGEPGFRPELDRDGDGEACESDGGNGDTGPAPDGDVYYANCTEVRQAGADPIRKGDPGYSRKLDRDGDGIGCE
ncbi:excalibur calcium-binding domain-containing protein [Micromonospora zamorensis]|uniref:excalibur calcium-binding domain-containing protein n=1 Tax=Micromonospora zamorensis TaxID=709883 RepID=UPI00352BC3AA|nr:excalibur calcium-binding domain-containing protein [Micromonospora zamorensis]